MNLFRTLGAGAVLTLSSLSLSSCLSAPDFPTTPEIEFKEVKNEFTPRSSNGGAFHTLTFVLDYRDGNGDLGLGGDGAPASDEEAPYLTRINNLYNRDGYNYHIQLFKLNRNVTPNQFQPLTIGEAGEFDGRFPRLPNTDKEGPVKGTLNYTLVLRPNSPAGGPFNSLSLGDEVRFEISIKDRALHESNKVTTTSIIIGQ